MGTEGLCQMPGQRQSEWKVLRRCILIVARLLKASATGNELLELVYQDEEISYETALRRFEEDRARLRNIGCVLHYDRHNDRYSLESAGVFDAIIEGAFAYQSQKIPIEGVFAMHKEYRSGMSRTEIGRKWNIAPNNVAALFKKHGLKLRSVAEGTKLYHEEKASKANEIRRLLASGVSNIDVARMVGVSRQYVSLIKRKMSDHD